MSAATLKRILVANRGEIVCRIARTARRMGITTIAVYSDADRSARHVRLADEAYHLGGAAAADSYLNIERIVSLALEVRADAVHPGYGFLSENAEFARRVVEAGLLFIGPPSSAIVAMGSKSASKAAMAAVGVPVAPGYHGDEQGAARLAAEADRVGYPLIIKASAGGGGKGMQVVHSSAQTAAAIASARRLARTAFADDKLLLERYFPRARHVEVQVFADSHGGTVALYDRDCSVQRRHQKIIEEAPAPGLRPQVRAAMASAAITAATAVNYVGAGTVEFLLDEDQRFYFMEMNTRLQVEHPVTELITGLDLVEWQIRVARGEPLPVAAADIACRGAAIEARLYAEDPGRGYLPSVGRIEHLRWPPQMPGVRLDHGVDAGDEVTSFYDPMLAKVIAWGESRSLAIDTLAAALDGIEIVGVVTNRALLRSVLGDESFRGAHLATDFLQTRQALLRFDEGGLDDGERALAGLWCATRNAACAESAAAELWRDSRGWRLGAPATTRWRFGDRVVTVVLQDARSYAIQAGASAFNIRVLQRGADFLVVEMAGTRRRIRVVELGSFLHLFSRGRHSTVQLTSSEDSLEVVADTKQGSLLTPLPGTVVAVHVSAGQSVARGAALVTVEAMKMEHTLTAPYAGTVEKVLFAPSDRVAAGAVLVALTPDA